MANEFTQYTDRDQRAQNSGDASLLGIMQNTKPNLVERGYGYAAVNKSFINGQCIDRGGHTATLLLNTKGDGATGSTPGHLALESGGLFQLENLSYLLTEGGTGSSYIPVPKSDERCTIRYNTLGGNIGAMVITKTKGYIVQPGALAQEISFPSGFTIENKCFAIQALDRVFVFQGDGLQPIVYDPAISKTAFVYPPDTTVTTGGYESIAWGKHAVYFFDRLWVFQGNTVKPSGIKDPYTYDPLQYIPIQLGAADRGVALFIWNQNTIMAFNENSIYAITGITGDLSGVGRQMVSPEVGCISPWCIVASGEDLYFYSGGAIYSVKQAFETRLQASSVSMADPILPTLSRVNQAYAKYAVSAVSNNRFYFSVPLDGSTENNAVLVYNNINKAWEGYHQSSSSKFNVSSFVSFPFLGKNRLFGLSKLGYIFLYDYDEADMIDTVSALERYPATSTFLSRGYCGSNSEYYGQMYGSGAMNKFAMDCVLHMQSLNPTYSVSILSDDVNNERFVEIGKTRNNRNYKTWGKSKFVLSNVSNDFSLPYRDDYRINLLDSPMYLWNGVNTQNRQSFSLPFKVFAVGNYFMVKVTNVGGNTNITNIELASLVKENAYDHS